MKDRIESFIKNKDLIYSMIRELALQYCQEFGCSAYHKPNNIEYFKYADIDLDKDYISVSWEDGHCSSCIETVYLEIPTSYLYDPDWKLREKNKREKIKAVVDKEKQVNLIKKLKEQEQNDRKTYEKLKRKFGGK